MELVQHHEHRGEERDPHKAAPGVAGAEIVQPWAVVLLLDVVVVVVVVVVVWFCLVVWLDVLLFEHLHDLILWHVVLLIVVVSSWILSIVDVVVDFEW